MLLFAREGRRTKSLVGRAADPQSGNFVHEAARLARGPQQSKRGDRCDTPLAPLPLPYEEGERDKRQICEPTLKFLGRFLSSPEKGRRRGARYFPLVLEEEDQSRSVTLEDARGALTRRAVP